VPELFQSGSGFDKSNFLNTNLMKTRIFFWEKTKSLSVRISAIFLVVLSFGILLSVTPASPDFGGVAAAAADTATETGKAARETYCIQLGAFRNEKNALGLAKKLKKRGYDAFILNEPGEVLHRVLIGRFGSRQEAAAEAKVVLKKEGMKSIIFRDVSGRAQHTPAGARTRPQARPSPAPVNPKPPKVEYAPGRAVVPSAERKAVPPERRPAPQTQPPPFAAPGIPPRPEYEPAPERYSSPQVKVAPAEVRPAPAPMQPAAPLSTDVSVELTATMTSPVMAATAGNVTFIPQATGGSGRYVYKFWLKGPSTGDTWKMVQNYSTSASYSWTPKVAGSYAIWVCARDALSSFGSEASAWMPFDVLENPPVASVEIAADKTSPALLATVGRVLFTAHAAGGSGNYEYKFWLKGPTTGNDWKVVQDYGISDSVTWTPTQAGHYVVWLYARNTGSPASREAGTWMFFDVVDKQPVRSVRLTSDKTSPVPPAVDGITFTAHAAGGSGKYEYEFWLKGPSTENSWEVVQDYGISNAFLWTPVKAGDYSIAVYARNTGSPAGYEAIAGVAFDITGK
jgi:hypothetical protein